MKRINILLLCSLITTLLFAEIPAGYYYKANHKCGSQLLDALNDICSNGTFLGYGSGEGYTWQGFYYTDRQADGSVIDMYSDIVRYQHDFNSVEGLHIEHSLPKSWWGSLENYAYRDLHHLFPADGTTNSTKNNLPLGEVTSATFDNGVSKIGKTNLYGGSTKCFEPDDEFKGDFARAYFYISTTYNELSSLWQSPMMTNSTYPVWTDEALDLLLKWHRQDPVSDKELRRQEAVYLIQHNRNPFIDYPEMVEHIWGNHQTTAFTLPKETRPFLSSPQAWTKIEFPTSYVDASVSQTIRFEGANFTNNIMFKLACQSPEITLSSNSITPTAIAQGDDLTITISSNTNKSIVDTLIICTADTLRLPISALFTDEFMLISATATSPTSARIEWAKLPNADTYDVALYHSPDNRTTDLFFSAYVEGSSYNKAVSIYNGTGRDIDLKYYSLRKQNNGTGAFKSNLPLSGTLRNGECYIIANSKADASIRNIAHRIIYTIDGEDNVLNFNGNDAIALYHNDILIDLIGEFNNSANWGKDLTLQRNTAVIAPNSTFVWSEWSKSDKDNFTPLSTHNVTLSASTPILSLSVNTNTALIDNLTPNQRYFVAVHTGNTSASNLLSFTTPAVATPEAYEATSIYSTQFTANWEALSYAESYNVRLLEITETEEVTIKEHFDLIGSNGQPLPEGWSGTASGSYTSTASSGESAPSLALKSEGEYIQTPLAPHPITYAQFMYRYPSEATNSYFIVYAINSQGEAREIDRIEYVNKTKTTLKYDNLNDTYALRIEYHKSAGNLAIDDIVYRYGQSLLNILDTETTSNNWFTFLNLTANTTYHYSVQAILANGTTTTWSNIVAVSTNDAEAPVAIQPLETEYCYYTNRGALHISELTTAATIRIYTPTGMIHSTIHTTQPHTTIPLQSGLYIIQITTSQHTQTIKLRIPN